MVGYGNWQNAITLVRANHYDLLRELKHLIETRLKITYSDLEVHLMRPAFAMFIKNVYQN